MSLKPWYKVVSPRPDLRDGNPLDASEFAVHLDKVREQKGPQDYWEPENFFDKTFLTQNLLILASEVVRRLSGIGTKTSAVFNMATQFGGGKTHALTLLYHLAKGGKQAIQWTGVNLILSAAKVKEVPQSATAVFVGTEFDSLSGRGGKGEPRRFTPWGEIAFQLGGREAFEVVQKHEAKKIAPAGDVIKEFLPKDKPCLILMDELMNYVSRNRKSGLSDQFYNFLHNLTEVVRGENNIVLAVSIPASVLEMNDEDHSDYQRYKKMLDRLGKAIAMSSENESSEIIRRRLFEWDTSSLAQDGRVILSADAVKTCKAYAQWISEYRQQLPKHFDLNQAEETFKSTYPFHPSVISVFERKWQSLPRFQRTRGVLRMLALWVSRAYQEGYKNTNKDTLITLGTATLEDSLFRSEVREQLGAEDSIEAVITSDVCGKSDSHAIALDRAAVDTIKKKELYRKVATTIFFESNGGSSIEKKRASMPEVCLAVGEPGLDLAHVDTVLDELVSTCYYLSLEKKQYYFSLSPNLNKLLSDRKASIEAKRIDDLIQREIQKIFSQKSQTERQCSHRGIQRIYFPGKNSDIPDRPILTFVVLQPESAWSDQKALEKHLESMTLHCGQSGRVFKNALIWCVPDSHGSIQREARTFLAWQEIQDESSDLGLPENQKDQLRQNRERASRDFTEAIWRNYKFIYMMGKNSLMEKSDMGVVLSSDSMIQLILDQLLRNDQITKTVNSDFLVRNWPPAFKGKEWSTKNVRDAFFASPIFPRLLEGDILKDTIASGVKSKKFSYLGKDSRGGYDPFHFGDDLDPQDVEFDSDMYILEKQEAEKYLASVSASSPVTAATENHPSCASPVVTPSGGSQGKTISTKTPSLSGSPSGGASQAGITSAKWEGEFPLRNWMSFYSKVLSKIANINDLEVYLSIEIKSQQGIPSKITEIKQGLRDLGLPENMEIS